MNVEDKIPSRGDVEIVIEWKDGRKELHDHRNTILTNGRRILARCLANVIGDEYEFYIARMVFGDGGTIDGVKRYVDAGRTGLFGTTQVSKPVIATLNPSLATQAIFTTVIRFDDALDQTLNEAALVLADGSLFSMVSFPNLTKTSDMQITFSWRISFV